VVGAGTWLSAGRPVAARETLSLADDRGIVEYVPGDLTLTARAGTRLSEIGAVTRAEGQWLPLDPWGGDAGTLGATISTATAGPHAHALGLPRDVVLGVEFVNGTGQVIRAGGRVVKNVAGFDLSRLVTGSWGTLGVITEVSVRLRAIPELTRSVAIPFQATHGTLNELATKLRALPFTALACEAINSAFARHLGLGDEHLLLVQLGGNEKAVAAQANMLAPFGAARHVDERTWSSLRAAEPPDTAAWRWSQLPSSFGDTWAAADRAARQIGAVWIHGNPMRGVVRAVATITSGNAAVLARAATGFGGTVFVERLPATAWARAPQASSDAVSSSIRAMFDPGRVLNPGIMGDA
jgi:glycolate oxidase FAD binding subunit